MKAHSVRRKWNKETGKMEILGRESKKYFEMVAQFEDKKESYKDEAGEWQHRHILILKKKTPLFFRLKSQICSGFLSKNIETSNILTENPEQNEHFKHFQQENPSQTYPQTELFVENPSQDLVVPAHISKIRNRNQQNPLIFTE